MMMKFNFGLLISEYAASKNPLVRVPDITRSYQDIPTFNENSNSMNVVPGDTVNIVSNMRTLTADLTTTFAISFPVLGSSVTRMTWTGVGTSPGFRTARSLGVDSTTIISVTRRAPSIVRFATVSGTAFSTLSILVGDFIRIERSTDAFDSPFSVQNQGTTLKIVGVGASTFDVQDNGILAAEIGAALGSGFATAMKVLSAGPVKVGDVVLLDGNSSLVNAGRYSITQVSDSYIEFISPQAYPETFVNNPLSVKIYVGLIGFINLHANGPIQISIDGNPSFGLGMLTPTDGIFFGSINAFMLQATNNTDCSIKISYQCASLVE
jgi:hypothetical protein